MRSPKWIRAQDLDNWARTPQAKLLLPELVRRLVRATVATGSLKKFDFPSEGETQRPGYDGTTFVTTGTPFVPDGVALWELGCDVGNPKGKADDDYDKRVAEQDQKASAGVTEDISQATYIAVTPCDWQRGQSWADDKTKERKFKEVRAYDSNRLEHWVYEAPAVGLWLAEEILGTRDGVWDLETHWENLLSSLTHTVSPEVLLANREEMKINFVNWLKAPNGQLAVKAPSVDELVDVFCAWAHSLPPEEAELVASRTIIVEDRETWRNLTTSVNPLILVAAPRLDADPNLYAAAERRHHVLRFAPFTARRSGAVEMERMRRFDVQEALKKSGVPDADATRLAEAAGGNFTILRRRLSRTPGDKNPDWGSESMLAPLLLAGSWQDSNTNDQQFVLAVTGGAQYGDIQTVMAKWQQRPDAPVRLVDGVWEFLSPMDAWEFLSPSITSTQLDAFHKTTFDVLGEDDPALDLPPEDRSLANFKGKSRKFSDNLRQGIAEILALGASRAEESSVATNLRFSDRATALVRSLLPRECDWKRWASLGDVLPQLVEAAPLAIIEAVERDLREPAPALVELMRQEIPPGGTAAVFGAAYHTGVLWALEKAGWSATFLPRVATALSKLAKLDPGGKWANRPESSLRSLFFSWRPQTMATLGERVECLKLLNRTEPAVTWKIFLHLLPQVSETISDNIKPSYRDWAAGWTGTITKTEYAAFISELVTLLLANVDADADRWSDLLDHTNGLASSEVVRVREQLQALVSQSLSSDFQVRLWEKLQNVVRDHTFFHDAVWALPKDEVDKLAAIAKQVEPKDIAILLRPLFDGEGLRDGDETLTFEERRKNHEARQRAAIRQLWSQGGVELLRRFARESRNPWAVGIAIADELKGEVQDHFVPDLLVTEDKPLRLMTLGYVRKRVIDEGLEWAQSIPTASWSHDQFMAFAFEMPFERRTWDWVAKYSKSAEVAYWKETAAAGGWRPPQEDAMYAVEQLQKAGRAWAALDLIAMLLFEKKSIESAVLCNALDAILSVGADDKQKSAMDLHNVTQTFEVLQERNDVDVPRLARLEFAFSPMLHRYTLLPRTLHRELATNPSFFVGCLTTLYRPRSARGDSTPPADPDGSKAEKARRIWRLLYDWQTIPGSDEHGQIDEKQLQSWLSAARNLAKDADRLELCDTHIGQVFANSDVDPTDGSIPAIAIRDVIEQLESENLERGYAIGLHNLRGTSTKGIYEGGKQERDIAAVFNRYADACVSWPRTASILRGVAGDYLREAVEEDERARARE